MWRLLVFLLSKVTRDDATDKCQIESQGLMSSDLSD